MNATREIDNSQDMIDSRDVIARIEELEGDLVDCDDGQECPDCDWKRDELKILKALADEASGYAADWQYGEALIRDSYFRDYAEELAEDCGMIQSDISDKWPYTCFDIDWEQAARELQQDYTCVDFDGVTYWIRS